MSKKLSIITLIISLCSLMIAIFALVNRQGISDETKDLDGNNRQYVMYVGTNDKDTYKAEYTQEEALKIVDDICLSYFDGYTLQEATVSLKDDTQKTTHEYTIVCYFDDAEKETVYKAADEVIKQLNQNSVLIETDMITTDFYSGRE